MPSESRRAVRVAQRIRQEVATALDRRIDDPRVANLVVSRVEVSNDLQHAVVFVRLSHGDGADARKTALRGVRSAASLVRRQLGASLGLRRNPELRFVYDEGLDAQTRIDQLLMEIEREGRQTGGEG